MKIDLGIAVAELSMKALADPLVLIDLDGKLAVDAAGNGIGAHICTYIGHQAQDDGSADGAQ